MYSYGLSLLLCNWPVFLDDKSHLFRDPSNLEKELAAMLRDRGDSANDEVSVCNENDTIFWTV